MATRPISQVPLIDVHARISRPMYDSMVAECAHCTCGITSFIRQAIAHEIATRHAKRTQDARATILEGQLMFEGPSDAK